ncbi:hypothetical protein [Gordonia sp. CPCC 205333]|uniref:hypothetical protein n=1 Tax=Gordonia sp. CPCC 205333 TaxID=3140790 RepID=UPI003AF3D53D
MNEVLGHIQHRAEITPTLTAVRHSGDAVSFERLDSVIGDYSNVVTAHGLSSSSALVAGLLNAMPNVARLSAPQIGDAIRDMVMWLGRDIEGGSSGRLHAVG